MKSTFRLPGFTAIAFFPGVAILAPLFLQFTSFGIVNTYWAMIIPDLWFALPLTVYLLVAYFQKLPADLSKRPGSTVARPGRRSGK